jgi:hypothetical protein
VGAERDHLLVAADLTGVGREFAEQAAGPGAGLCEPLAGRRAPGLADGRGLRCGRGFVGFGAELAFGLFGGEGERAAAAEVKACGPVGPYLQRTDGE